MPEGHSFAMAASQKDDHIYVADPIAQHVLRVDIDEMSIEGDMELDVTPSKLIWLGIKEEGEDEHDHNHD